MTKKPFSFFLELLFVLFFFLITSTILIEIYAKMVQISQTDTYRQDAMVIAQNKIETSASVGEYSQEMHDNIYDVKISNVNKIGRASVGKECPVLCRSRWSPYH